MDCGKKARMTVKDVHTVGGCHLDSAWRCGACQDACDLRLCLTCRSSALDNQRGGLIGLDLRVGRRSAKTLPAVPPGCVELRPLMRRHRELLIKTTHGYA